MKLKVNLMSLFAKYSKEDSEGFTHLDQGRTIKALAEHLGLPLERVRLSWSMVNRVIWIPSFAIMISFTFFHRLLPEVDVETR